MTEATDTLALHKEAWTTPMLHKAEVEEGGVVKGDAATENEFAGFAS